MAGGHLNCDLGNKMKFELERQEYTFRTASSYPMNITYTICFFDLNSELVAAMNS